MKENAVHQRKCFQAATKLLSTEYFPMSFIVLLIQAPFWAGLSKTRIITYSAEPYMLAHSIQDS